MTTCGQRSDMHDTWGKLILALMLSLFATCLALLAFLAWTMPSSCALDGASVATSSLKKPALLSHVGSDGFDTQASWTMEGTTDELANLSLLLLRANDATVFMDGMPVAAFDAQNYQAVRIIDLPAKEIQTASNATELRVEACGLFLSYSVFLGETLAVHTATTVYYALHYASLAILVVMFVYAISLWIFKRDESYLLVFAAYLAAVFLSYLIRLTFQPTLSSLSYATLTAFLSAAKYCAVAYTSYLLTCNRLPSVRTNFVALLAMLSLSLVRGFISAASLSVAFSEITRVVLVLAASVIIAAACARRSDGALILLVGYAPVAACEIIKASGVANACMSFSLWSYTAVFDLPFALACMLFINRRFAGRHRAAQDLASELARLNKTLDARVEQRTQEATRQASRRKGLMLNVYHDLRSPLFVLKGCLDMLGSARNDTDRTEIVNIMRERLGIACALAEDLFTLAKLEDGEMDIPMETVRFDEVVRSTSQALRVTAAKKDVRLTVYAEDSCTVWGNGPRLGQVVQNLLSNAIAYTPEGGSVHVALVASGAICALRVSDTGRGISPGDLPHVFEKYYRVDPKDHVNSTGLGLSIAKSIVERHRGSIRAESEKGCGSTFIVEIPICQPLGSNSSEHNHAGQAAPCNPVASEYKKTLC